MIEIQELYKYYGDRRAIGPLSAQIQKGEIVGLLGLNGSGKTTTLRILACDLMPTSGTVRVGGFDVVANPDAVRSKVGYLPDRPPLYDDMTVAEYLRFAARLRRVPSAETSRAVDEAVELTELGEVSGQMIGTLSHGFRQRVGIAQAIVHRPDFVVLDEPISGLDPVQIVEMRELVQGLAGAHTVIVSSHILSEISETCDRILVIDQGRIAWAGTESDLSAELGQSMRLELTTRTADALALRDKVSGVTGVQSAEIADPAEAGPNVVTLRVTSTGDVREELGRVLADAKAPLLQLVRHQELEGMVLKLLGGDEASVGRRRGRRRREEAASAPVPAAEGGNAA